jgi:DNA-binding CsgD family transcriptional regulator
MPIKDFISVVLPMPLRPMIATISLGANEFLLRLAKDTSGDMPAEFSSELGLTTREGEVLSWLSKGKTNRDIAQILGLSPRTVDKHLEQMYSKLGVENRTAAAAIAVNARNKKA